MAASFGKVALIAGNNDFPVFWVRYHRSSTGGHKTAAAILTAYLMIIRGFFYFFTQIQGERRQQPHSQGCQAVWGTPGPIGILDNLEASFPYPKP